VAAPPRNGADSTSNVRAPALAAPIAAAVPAAPPPTTMTSHDTGKLMFQPPVFSLLGTGHSLQAVD
jgi:hypothetical protein